MNRRDTLSTLLGKKQSKKNTAKPMSSMVTELTPYAGSWGFKQAAHLLRRTTFGPTWGQIQTSVTNGLQDTISQLLALNPLSQMPDPPINYYYEEDPDVPVGETWINVPFSYEHRIHRRKSLEGWTTKLILEEGTSIREKMTLFWHNHFVIANFPSASRYKYQYISTIREYATGNFRELTKTITIDPMMLSYLNGNLNTKEAPNENYARELLELFTVGKGPVIAPGDYSFFTEHDVAEIARILTGWGVSDNNTQGNYIQGIFTPSKHDVDDKELSHHFNNEMISDAGENEYSILIDKIFEHDEVAKFICRKIYRWFVHYEITSDIEINIIEPLAQVLRDNDYEISSILQILLTSQHFFDEERIGCMIKNPWDFSAGLIKQFQVQFPSEPATYYETYRVILQGVAGLQMEYFNPPSVAGWKPYYQAPNFYRIWLNSVTLPIRNFAIQTFVNGGIPIFQDPAEIIGIATVDYLNILDNLSNPFEVNQVLEDFIQLLFPKDISNNQKIILKERLTNGLPDFEWTDEYSLYISDPSNTAQANAIRTKINNLVASMLTMPEYQLM